MHTIGKILKTIREERGLQLRQVAIESNIDLTLLSRVENGKRMPSESLLIKLAETYGLDSNLLVLQLVSDKILEISEQYPDHTIEALKVAQEKARLGERYISFFMNSFISRPIGLESRRYIGNKTKLTDWIMETIRAGMPRGAFVLRYFCRDRRCGRESNTLLRPSDIQRFALCQPSHLSRVSSKKENGTGINYVQSIRRV